MDLNNTKTNNTVVNYILTEYMNNKQYDLSSADVSDTYNFILKEAVLDIDIEAVSSSLKDGSYHSYRELYKLHETVDFSVYNSKDILDETISLDSVKVSSLEEVVKRLKSYNIIFDDSWNFRIFNHNEIATLDVKKTLELDASPFVITLADIKDNIAIIDKELSMLGYNNVFSQQYTDSDNRHWIHVLYNPKDDVSANELLRNKRFVYHLSPIYNDNSIMKTGISSHNSIKYDNKRVFCYTKHIDEFNISVKSDKDFIEMIYHKIKNDTASMNMCVIYPIELSRIEDVEFYLDPNSEHSVYCCCDIPKEAILFKRRDVITFSNNNGCIETKFREM